MKKIIFFLILIALGLVVGAGYFAYEQFKPQLDNIISNFKGETINIDLVLNSNLESNVALVGTVTDQPNESYTVLTQNQKGTEIIDKIILRNAENETGVIELDSNGYPTVFVYENHEAVFSNYTETGVDIKLTTPDGNIQTFEQTPYSIAAQSFIPYAHAAGSLVSHRPPEGTSRASLASDVGNEFLSYLSATPGTAINIVLCGVLSVTAPPFAVGQCGSLAVRIISHHVNIGPCKQDVLDCAFEAIKSSFKQKGPSIGGAIAEKNTGQGISAASVVLSHKNGNVAYRTQTNAHGQYRIPGMPPGPYVLMVIADKQERTFAFATTNERIKIVDSESGTPLIDQNYNLEQRNGFKKIQNYFGQELNQTFNVRLDIGIGTPGKFDGLWKGTASAAVEQVPDVTEPGTFYYCLPATWQWTIEGKKLSGQATIDGEETIQLNGTIKDDGSIDAGAGIGIFNAVTFTGVLQETGEVSGSWKDVTGCYGTFSGENSELQKSFLDTNQGSGETAPIF